MRRRLLILPLFLFLLLYAVGPAFAQEMGPVVAELSVPRGTFKVGDPIELTLAVTHPAGYHVIMPQLTETWGDLSLREQSDPTTVANGDGTETTSQMLSVQLFAPGTFSTPALPITVTDGDGTLADVLAAPVPVTIDSVLAEGDTDLKDIKPQASLPLPNGWPWVAAGLAAMTLLGLWFIWRWRRRTPVVDNRPPHEIALESLARIEQIDLPSKGQFKEYYTLVSDIVRIYVEQVFAVPMLERTTSEIQSSLAASTVPPQVADQLVAFLDASDLVKFSTFEPDVPSARALTAQARAIVLATKPVETAETGNHEDSPPASKIRSGGQYRPAEVLR